MCVCGGGGRVFVSVGFAVFVWLMTTSQPRLAPFSPLAQRGPTWRIWLQAVPGIHQVDQDPENMWKAEDSGSSQGKRKKPTAAETIGDQAAEALTLALHCRSNIPHKDQLALFVPSSHIMVLAVSAGLFQESVLRQSFDMSQWRSSRS